MTTTAPPPPNWHLPQRKKNTSRATPVKVGALITGMASCPPPTQCPDSLSPAEFFNGWRYLIGDGAHLPSTVRPVAVTPQKQEHVFVVGPAGSGRTTALRNIAAQLQLAGWQIFCLGGGAASYSSRVDVRIPQAGPAFDAMSRSLRTEHMRRHRARLENPNAAEGFTPIAIVLDDVTEDFAKVSLEAYEMVSAVLRIGGPVRMQVFVAAAPGRPLPARWRWHSDVVIALGPADAASTAMVPFHSRAALQVATEGISPLQRGRGAVVVGAEVTALRAFHASHQPIWPQI